MATNQILPFGTGANPLVLSNADWTALAARSTGFANGIADPAQCNTAWRQASVVASMIAQFIVDTAAVNVLDDGNVATLEANFIAALKVAATGRQLAVIHLSASTTYTPPAGTKYLIVHAYGAGGAGGGAYATSANSFSTASGGGSGSYGRAVIVGPAASIPVVIGAAGANAQGAQGGNGGSTSFGPYVTAPGGGGGPTSTCATTSSSTSGQGAPGGTPTGSAVVLACGGQPGPCGNILAGYGPTSGQGAPSPLGGGGGVNTGGGLGGNASSPGAGGGGSANAVSVGNTGGGLGGAGLVIVEAYS